MQIVWDADLSTLLRRYGDRTALVDAGGPHSYADLLGRAAGVADLLAAAGAGPGVAVATSIANSAAAAWASLGCLLAGVLEVPLNRTLTPEERRYGVEVAGVRHVLVSENGQAGFEGVAAHDVASIRPAPLMPGRWPRPAADDPARINFTSGTTGQPKAVVSSHARRWTANLMQRAAMPFLPGADDRVLLVTPFTHGASLIALAFWHQGSGVHLMDGIDDAAILGLLEARAVNQLFAPPTVLARIVAAAEGRRFDHVRLIWCGTATLSPGLYGRARAIFGPVVRVTYGMSEMVNPITVLEPEETDVFYATGEADGGACLGRPAAGVAVEVRDEAGRRLPPGEAGEIFLNGPQRCDGYLRDGRLDALADADFHATGDLGRLDGEGRLFLLGRLNDVVKTGGYKVFPQEVEAALSPALGEVGVVGLSSEHWGEVLACAVPAPRPDDWQARGRAAAEVLSPAKRPRLWVEVAELPRNRVGKVDRRALRTAILADWRLEDGRRPVLVRAR